MVKCDTCNASVSSRKKALALFWCKHSIFKEKETSWWRCPECSRRYEDKVRVTSDDWQDKRVAFS